MPVSPIFALGLLSQSVFFGAHVVGASVFIPTIRRSDASPSVQVKLWEGLYDKAAPIMASSAFASFACYMYEAYNAGAGSILRQFAIRSGMLSISALPFTLLVIMGTSMKLKSMRAMDDEKLEENNYGSLIDRWNKLSIVRMCIFGAGIANALCYLVKY